MRRKYYITNNFTYIDSFQREREREREREKERERERHEGDSRLDWSAKGGSHLWM